MLVCARCVNTMEILAALREYTANMRYIIYLIDTLKFHFKMYRMAEKKRPRWKCTPRF